MNHHTTQERQLTRALSLRLLGTTVTPEVQAVHLIQQAGSADAALALVNEAHDDISRHLTSVALHIRTQPKKA